MVEGNPRIVGVIPDGNRRWSERHGKPRRDGHRTGMQRIEDLVEESAEQGIKKVVVFVASSDNIQKRGEEQKTELAGLLDEGLKTGPVERMLANGVALHTMGDYRNAFGERIAYGIEEVVAKSAGNKTIDVFLAIKYNGHQEIADAAEAVRMQHPGEQITTDLLQQHLYVPEPVDLIIRTGAQGRNRLSNFLVWQAGDAELYFTKTLFPDFTKSKYRQVLTKYRQETVINKGK
jgi:undecaprenyl diphosphate synthase